MNLDVLPELPKGEETEWKKGIAETSPRCVSHGDGWIVKRQDGQYAKAFF